MHINIVAYLNLFPLFKYDNFNKQEHFKNKFEDFTNPPPDVTLVTLMINREKD